MTRPTDTPPREPHETTPLLGRLALFIARHRWPVIAVWIALTLVGAVASGSLGKRWYQSSAVPGQPAYEAGQRTLHAFGAGVRAPDVVVFHTAGDATRSTAIEQAMRRAAATMPGAGRARTSPRRTRCTSRATATRRSRSSTPPARPAWTSPAAPSACAPQRAAASRPRSASTSPAATPSTRPASTDRAAARASSSRPSSAAVGALVVLLFVFGTLPAVLMPLAVAIAAILNTFTLVWALTHVTSVSIIVQFLIALVGLGIAIDYALLMIMRFRDELREGSDVETALVATMTHAGRSVIVSGSTVAIGLLAMTALPLPLVRSMGIGGMLIPAVSVLASLTLLPALLAVLGTRIDRFPVMPRRLVGAGPPRGRPVGPLGALRAAPPGRRRGRRRVIVAALAGLGTQLHATEAPLKNFPGTGTAIAGRDQLARAGITPGVMKPIDVLVERGGDAERGRRPPARRPGVVGRGARSLARRPELARRGVPGDRRRRARHPGDPRPRRRRARGTNASMTGIAAVDRDFVHALFGRLPYVFALVLVLTLMLLTRAFRSIVLAAQGRAAEPRLARRRASASSCSSSSRATAPRCGTSPPRSR